MVSVRVSVRVSVISTASFVWFPRMKATGVALPGCTWIVVESMRTVLGTGDRKSVRQSSGLNREAQDDSRIVETSTRSSFMGWAVLGKE